MLDPDTDAALAELAAAHPGLLTYDAQRGMVKFNADLTFALGSTEIKPEAVGTLRQFAEILNSASAARYEVRILGHTDNVPVSRPATKQKHPNNWYLSAHRSISVMEVLTGSGVPGQRVIVAGAGEFRPVVANAGRRGAEANRRVEIYLVPMDPRDLSPSVESGAAAADNAPAGSGGAYMDKTGSGGAGPAAPDMSK
ncbi:MAG: OmpA family protein [Phycisphaeraceae bacterium]|nr:OmpA family protein [Phycisphaeraceae bacterium]